ncbi:hypothetical protein F5888DRAFT_1887452 [Russula emetica]|nr:hypothetical protein F5888DRAFT_1887452 [Russula emetica]
MAGHWLSLDTKPEGLKLGCLVAWNDQEGFGKRHTGKRIQERYNTIRAIMIPVLVHHMGPMTPMCLARAVDRVYLSLRMHWQRSIATYVVGWDMHVKKVTAAADSKAKRPPKQRKIECKRGWGEGEFKVQSYNREKNVKRLTDDADDRKPGSKIRTHPASIFAERALYAELALNASATWKVPRQCFRRPSSQRSLWYLPMQEDGENGYITLCPKQGLVLTGGTYKGCSDDVLVVSKFMVDLVVVELDTMDSLSLFLGNIWLV